MRIAKRLALLTTVVAALAIAGPAFAAPPAHFGEEGTGAGQFVVPSGVAVAQQGGDVYIADRNNNRIDKFGPEGEFLRAWGFAVADGSTEALQACTETCFGGEESPFKGPGTGQLHTAEGVAVDNGDVYVVDAGNHRVQEFGPEGEFILMLGGEVNATEDARSGATEAQKNLCTAASGDTCKAGAPGHGSGQFEHLTGRSIAVDSSGEVYVGDEDRIQRFSSGGAVLGQLALPGVGDIENLAVDSQNDVYIGARDFETGIPLPGIHEYDELGAEVGAPRDASGEPSAIALGPSGELFVNDGSNPETHHILEYDPAGTQISSFDAGAESGELGIAYGDGPNGLYVLNAGAVRFVTPPPPGPLVDSQSSTAVEPTSATLDAKLNPEGHTTTYHFQYGTTTAYGESTKAETLTGGEFEDQPAGANLVNLQPRTTYHFRVVAVDDATPTPHTSFGPDETFTTPPPVSIDGESASQVTATSAQLEAELNPHGVAGKYRFEYLTEAEFEANGESFTGAAKPVLVPSPPEAEGSAGSGTVDVVRSATIQGLAPSTAYRYRVVATNRLGTVEGEDRTFITQGAAGSVLPDGREWELVSPPNKHGSPLEAITEEGGVIQAAVGGGGLAYVAKGPVDVEPPGVRSPQNTQLLAARDGTGWVTEDVTTPHKEISIVHAGFPSEYKLFSEDLQAGVVEPEGATRLAPDDPANTERTPYRRAADGDYEPLVNTANVPPGTSFGGVFNEGTGTFNGGVAFVTATPDLSHLVLISPQVLTPDSFKPGFVPAEKPNLYELSDGTPHLISVLPGGEPTAEAGLTVGVGGHNELDMRGAISTDGNRVFFEASEGVGGERLYVRDVGLGQTLQLNTPQGGAPGGPGGAIFQGASSDGGKVFFTDTSRLTKDATAKASNPDLYMCKLTVIAGRLACTLSDLTVDPNPGEVADVQGDVAAINAAGTHVYFAADGVLTGAPNARGEHAVPGDCASEHEAPCNLYLYDTASRQTELVAVLSSSDFPDWNPGRHGLANLTARVSPNGRYLAFMSQRGLTGYDNEDATSKQRGERIDEEVFLFDAEAGAQAGADALSCVSCNPTGARPLGVFDPETFPGLLVDHPHTWENHWLAASIPGWTGVDVNQALYQSRYLSNSGRMFFDSSDALVAQDTNSVEDVYEYERVGGTESTVESATESSGQPASNSCTRASATYSGTSGGCVGLISAGTSKEESAFLDASETGDDAFFLTSSRLSTLDVDSAADVYDAHACSAASPCPPPPPPAPAACEGDACQGGGVINQSSSDAGSGSLTFYGPGNLTAKPAVKPKAKPLTRAQKLSRALKTCRKKKGSKRKGCEASARKRYGPAKKSKKGASKKKQ